MAFQDNAYDIIIEAGQSNAQGTGRGEVSEEYIPNEDIIYLTPAYSIERKELDGIEKMNVVYNDQLPTFAIADERIVNDQKTGDFSLTFAKEYKDSGLLKNGRKILIIRAAIGATGFKSENWGLGKPLYLKMIEMINYALSLNPENKITALLWHQGEHEIGKENPPKIYYEQLSSMLFAVKEKYEVPDLPFITGDFVNEWKSTKIEKATPIVNVIKRVTEEMGGIFIETADLLSNNQKNGDGDIIHFCRESLHVLGKRYFKAYCDIVRQK